MKLGIDTFSTRNSGLDPLGVLRLASEWGLAGVLFELSPFTSFHDDHLRRIHDCAEEKKLYLEFGMGSILRWHPMAEKGRQLLAEAGCDIAVSDAQIVIEHLRIAKKLGSPLLRCVACTLLTRQEGHDMMAVADQVVAVLREACRAAEDLGIRMALENHADFTVRELAAIYTRVNSPALGFTVDCGNVAFDLDNPLRLAEILAPHALTTHFKNYRIIRTHEGLALENCALDEGELDIVAMAELLAKHNPQLNLNIEIHSQYAPFRLDLLSPAFWAKRSPPPGDGLAWYLEKSWTKAPLAALPDNLPDGAESWEREARHLRQSISWAKKSLQHLLAE